MTFSDCIEIIRCDLRSRRQRLSVVCLLKDPIARFHVYLRLLEYAGRRGSSPVYYFLKWRFLALSTRLGFSIPENTLGKGVYLPHHGTITVNSRSFVGDFSVLNVDVVIGRHPSSKAATPKLGHGVYVGPGVKIFGELTVGDCSVIGANSVVTGNVPEQQLWAGAPARAKRLISEQEYRSFIAVPDAWQYWKESVYNKSSYERVYQKSA